MKVLLMGVILFIFIRLQAQSSNRYLMEPEVGRPCPNVVFAKIDFYQKKTLNLSDLKGRWVVLDFWSRFCSGCVGSFPGISREQVDFGDSVQFVMIAPDSTTRDRMLYANYHQKLDLKMPCAFDDGLFYSFNVGQLPHMVVIDPNGIVRAVTLSADASKLKELMNGGHPIFSTASYANKRGQDQKVRYSASVPYLTYGNGGTDSGFLFRSLLSRWRPDAPVFGDRAALGSPKDMKNTGRFELGGKSIAILYLAAYLGKTHLTMGDSLYGEFSATPVFEVKDSGVLRYDYVTGENLYCYSLIIPKSKASQRYMMQIMQGDLKNYFGYDVSIEVRKMPYWRVIATDSGRIRLKTRGGPARGTDNGKPWQELSLNNCPMANFMKVIDLYSGVSRSGAPLLDETGIATNIDIDLDWAKGDYEVCRKALQKNGLDLIAGEKEMKTIVVRDAGPQRP